MTLEDRTRGLKMKETVLLQNALWIMQRVAIYTVDTHLHVWRIPTSCSRLFQPFFFFPSIISRLLG